MSSPFSLSGNHAMDSPIQVDLGRIAQDLQIRRVQVESVVQLLDEGNTVPFITRYRKERTGNLNEVAIREIQTRVGRLRELGERKETILKAIEAQGKLSEELASAIKAADNPKRLEDLYLPFKPKKKTKASDARDRGLEPLALRIWNHDDTLIDLNAAAQEFVNPEKEIETTEKVLEGVGHILAEAINELAIVRDAVRRVVWKTGKIVTSKAEIPEGEGLEYRDYFEYSEPVANIPPHRVLAINRGDKEGPLKVKLEVSRPELEAATNSQLPLEGHPQAEFFRKSALDALDRLLLPSMEREVRRDMTEMAERHAVDVFARNLRSLLLQPPIPKQVVMAIDPGFRNGCKVAVLGTHGELLDHGVIHPHPPQNRRHEAKVFLKDLVGKHKVGVVAIGNGTACRETEELIAEIISEGTHFHNNPELAAEAEQAAQALPTPADNGEVTASSSTSVEEDPTEGSPAITQSLIATHHAEETPASEPGEFSGVESEPEPDGEPEPVESMPPISGGAPEGEADPTEHEPKPAEPAAAVEAELASPTEPSAQPTHPDASVGSGEPESPNTEAPTQADVSTLPGVADDTSATSAEGPVRESEKAEAEKRAEASGEPRGNRSGPRAKSGSPRPGKGDRENRPQKPKGPPPPPRPHQADAQLAQLAYVIVNEAGASVYSVSPVGREEFPDFDDKVRGTISIGRRLLDPLAELVKIEPQNIGVGLYQHDVNPKQLKESLEGVIASCVNFVGVDLNTASIPLLRHVSGLNQLTARRVVERRSQKGPFTDRSQLLEVEGVGPATYTQAAGFLKVGGGENPLDRTWVHPESYPVVEKLLASFGLSPEIVRQRDRLPELHTKLDEADIPALAKELEIGEPTLRDIFEALARPDRDPRDDLPKPIFKKGVLKLEDLVAGMELKGTVLNVVDFGAFVDIGLKDSGLVHISQIANRYIKSPHDVVSVGDVVTIWVMGVDGERKRVSLTMVKPGTERPRAERGAPGQGQNNQRRPQGGEGPAGERRPGGGPGRGPRRELATPSNLTSPPVGTPPASGAGPEGPPRRPERPAAQTGGGRESNFRPASSGNRGGPRFGGGPGGGSGGFGGRGGPGGGRPPERPVAPMVPPKPAKPLPPPPPLSKDALAGSVPLRSFGQLKQLWQAKDDDEPTEGSAPTSAPESTSPPTPSPDA